MELDSRYDTSINSLIGLNDIAIESLPFDQTISSNWVWSDGTDYDFALSWNSNQPNGMFCYIYISIRCVFCMFVEI